MPDPQITFIDRDQLSLFLPNPRSVAAFEGLMQTALVTTPIAVTAAQTTATSAQGTADTAAIAAAAAQSTADTIAAAALVVLALSGALDNERVLTGGAGVTLDTATASVVKVVVNALTILNAAPVVITQPTDVQNSLRCDSLQIDQAPSASVTAASHALAINLNGTVYYLKLSATP